MLFCNVFRQPNSLLILLAQFNFGPFKGLDLITLIGRIVEKFVHP